MSHIQLHLNPSEYNFLSNKWEAEVHEYLASLQWRLVWALEGTPDMAGKVLWTKDWDKQARWQINVNAMQVAQLNTTQNIFYVPAWILEQIQTAKVKFDEILPENVARTLKIAPILSDKSNMFLHRTSTCRGKSDLEDRIWNIHIFLQEESDIPENIFLEWLITSPDDIEPQKPGIIVEWLVKDHRIDSEWNFQSFITKKWRLIWAELEQEANTDWKTLWDWTPKFHFKNPEAYHHILPPE